MKLHITAALLPCREAASDWGLQCMRYEIRDISPPAGVRAAMELQVCSLQYPTLQISGPRCAQTICTSS